MYEPSAATVRAFAAKHGTPVYVYSRAALRAQAAKALSFGGPFGLTVRYAVKANPHREVLRVFLDMGLSFDASSEFEATHLLAAGIPASRVALNSQQLPGNLTDVVQRQGVFFTATSLHQLEEYGRALPGTNVGVRLNPGKGSGASNRVTTGGPSAGFGVWHEYIPQLNEIAKRHRLTISKVHTHIGAGTDPEAWKQVAAVTLDLAKQFPDATTVSLGGGFKVARMPDERTADLQEIGGHVTTLLEQFAAETGRKLHLEIEPGTFLTALCGVLVSRVIDITDTGKNGFTFIRLDTGMNDILRPTMYGALHPITVHSEAKEHHDYVVIGHNCESGDILTPVRGNSEEILPRRLAMAQIGDLVTIGAAGAYCASMRAKDYNFFKNAEEVIVDE
jgi:diaminopimelate decarboxylase